MPLPAPIITLTEALSRLPGIGPRSAERLALHLAQSDADAVRHLAQTLIETRERIRVCSVCGALTETEPCAICGDPRRDPSMICLVEQPVDIFAMEKAGAFRGQYHVLGGKISPLNGVGPDDLRIGPIGSAAGARGEGDHSGLEHGRGRGCDRFLPGQTAGGQRGENFPHRLRAARRAAAWNSPTKSP